MVRLVVGWLGGGLAGGWGRVHPLRLRLTNHSLPTFSSQQQEGRL